MKKKCMSICLCLCECCLSAKCYSLAHGLNVTVYRSFLYRINVVPFLSGPNVQETQTNLDPFIRTNDWPSFSRRFTLSNNNPFRIKLHTNKYHVRSRRVVQSTKVEWSAGLTLQSSFRICLCVRYKIYGQGKIILESIVLARKRAKRKKREKRNEMRA